MKKIFNNYSMLIVSSVVYFVLYAKIIDYPKVWDDISFMNIIFPDVHSLFPLILKHFQTANWPIFQLFIELNERVFGGNVTGYHLFNIFFHFLNGVLIYKVLEKLKVAFKEIIFVVFLLHPLQVFTVASLIQFKTILALSFLLISFLFLLNFIENGRKREYVFSILAFLFMAKTKSSFVLLPFIYFFIMPKNDYKLIIPYIVLSLYSILGLIYTGEVVALAESSNLISGAATDVLKNDLIYRFSLVVNNCWYYLTSFFDFSSLKPIYGRSPVSILGVVLKLTLMISLLIFTFVKGDRKTKIATLLFLLIVAPVSGFIYAPYMTITPVSNQHSYLAVVPLVYLMTILFGSFLNKKKVKNISVFMLLLVMSYSTNHYFLFFKNNMHFHLFSTFSEPVALASYINLAKEYNKRLKFKKALDVLNKVENNEKMWVLESEMKFVEQQKNKLQYNIIQIKKTPERGP